MEDEELEAKEEGCGCASEPEEQGGADSPEEAGAEQECPEDTESPPQAGQ